MGDMDEIRAELERQREAQEARDQAILDRLSRAEQRPTTAADVARTMANGYAQEDERRKQAAAGGEQE